jgi:hypothetical protein
VLEDGQIQGRQDVLLELGSKKLGQPGEDVAATIRSIKDLERLRRMSHRLLDVTNWQDLLATP